MTNKEREQISTEHKEAPKVDELARSLVMGKLEKQDATAVILAFLESNGSEVRSQKAEELLKEIGEFAEQETETRTIAYRDRYYALISGGRQEFEEQLNDIERNESLDVAEKETARKSLYSDYKSSIVMEKLMKMSVIKTLLGSVLNPYLSPQELEKRTGTTYNPGEKKWQSHFDPRVHYGKGAEKLLSPQTVKAVQIGLEKALTMKERVKSIKDGVEKELGRSIEEQGEYDKAGAQTILFEILGKEKPPLQGRARVIVGPLSITIVFEEDDDYNNYYGEGVQEKEQAKLSAGVHLYAGGGILNLSRRWGAHSGTIAHEEEHALNEILMKSGNQTSDAPSRVARAAVFEIENAYLHCLKRASHGEGIADNEIDGYKNILVEAIQKHRDDLVAQTAGWRLVSFGDETLAHMLASKRSADEVFKILTTSDTYPYLHPDKIVENSNDSRAWDNVISKIRQSLNPDSLRNFDGDPAGETKVKGVYERLLNSLIAVRSDHEKSTTASEVQKLQRSIIDSVEKLKQKNFSDNEIRALLAGENPATWPKLVEAAWRYNSEERRAPKEQVRSLAGWYAKKEVKSGSDYATKNVSALIRILTKETELAENDFGPEMLPIEVIEGIDIWLRNLTESLKKNEEINNEDDFLILAEQTPALLLLRSLLPEKFSQFMQEIGQAGLEKLWVASKKSLNKQKEFLSEYIQKGKNGWDARQYVWKEAGCMKQFFSAEYVETLHLEKDPLFGEETLTEFKKFIGDKISDFSFNNNKMHEIFEAIKTFEAVFPGQFSQLQDEETGKNLKEYLKERLLIFLKNSFPLRNVDTEEASNIKQMFPELFKEFHIGGLILSNAKKQLIERPDAFFGHRPENLSSYYGIERYLNRFIDLMTVSKKAN